MNNDVRNLVYAILYKDSKTIKAYTKVLLLNDNTSKDSAFVKSALTYLEEHEHTLKEVPHDVKGLITCENLKDSFLVNRHYFREDEEKPTRIIHNEDASDEEILSDIKKIREKGGKMKVVISNEDDSCDE